MRLIPQVQQEPRKPPRSRLGRLAARFGSLRSPSVLASPSFAESAAPFSPAQLGLTSIPGGTERGGQLREPGECEPSVARRTTIDDRRESIGTSTAASERT